MFFDCPFTNVYVVLCYFSRAPALKVICLKIAAGTSFYINLEHALAMNRHILVSYFGHLASLVWTT